jgi:uncharacterized cupredoxin-like copper-binding protein
MEEQKTDVIEPGGTSRLTVTLKAGKVTLYCPVDDHRSKGTQVELTVG